MYLHKSTLAGVASILCALAVVVGSVTPWYRVGHMNISSSAGSIPASYEYVGGLEVLGNITLGAALLALLLIGMQTWGKRGAGLAGSVALAVSAAIGVAKWDDAWSYSSGPEFFAGGVAVASWGLLLVIAGGVLGAIFAVWQFAMDAACTRQRAPVAPQGGQ